MKLIESTMVELRRALDVRMRRHDVLAGNVANADTPGYVARDLDFDAAMEIARQGPASPPLALADAGAGEPGAFLPIVPPSAPPQRPAGAAVGQEGPLVPLAGTSPGLDGNAVDLDRTMVAMAENALLYGATAKAASKKLAILRYVASDGNA